MKAREEAAGKNAATKPGKAPAKGAPQTKPGEPAQPAPEKKGDAK